MKKLGDLSNLLGLIAAIITISSVIISIVKQSPQWIFIIFFVLFLGLFIFIHRFKNITKDQSTDIIERKYFFTDRQRIGAGIAIVSILVLTNLIQFFPGTNRYIQSIYWPIENIQTATKYLTSSPDKTPSYTVTPNLSSTTTFTLSPTNTSTLTPKYTITTTLTPIYDFKDGCISTAWHAWPTTIEQTTINSNKCMDFSGIGVLANEEGLRIFSKPNKEEVFAGLFTKIPRENATITIKIKIDILQTNSFEENTNIYIGFVDSSEQKLTGKLLYFKDYKIEYFPVIIFGDYPGPTDNRQIVRSSMPLGPEITIIWKKDKLAFNLKILGFEKPIEITDIPYDNNWDGFFIGYDAPKDSAVSALVTEIQIEEK